MAAQVALRRQQQARDNLHGADVNQRSVAAYQRRLRNFQRHRLHLTQTRISVTRQDLRIVDAVPDALIESNKDDQQNETLINFDSFYPTYPQIPWFPYFTESTGVPRNVTNEARNPYDNISNVEKTLQMDKKSKISFSVESIIGSK
ncbi:uncharacterized protein LOC131666412 [Phymastichus coffea]|uniref:uncharacterized protein LOC131666412 n=1 Tax=Phymastichus coffea TaxID=108790 RepID=UPI00273BEEF5|nr:uncharacterized protein LOC131666412 [Phymastichus coffea]